jgi:hypothetical protein
VQITLFFIILTKNNIELKVVINPDFENKRKEIEVIFQTFFKTGNLRINGARNILRSEFLNDLPVMVKFFKKPDFIKSIVYTFFRESKAKRSYDYAFYLTKNKINTPLPIAYYEERKTFNLLQKSFYLCSNVDYDFTFRELIHNPIFPERNIILEQFAEFTFKMHEAGINFLDHSPGNTLIIKKEPGLYEFYLIDLNRMKFEELSFEQRMDNFKKLWMSKRMIKTVAAKYAQLMNENEDLVFSLMMKKTTEFKRKTARKKYFKRFLGM